MRLRSMPALPMRGPSDMDMADADHENASLDEMDEMGDVMEEDEDEAPADHMSDEEDDMMSLEAIDRRVREVLPPSLSRTSPRSELPPVDTSQLGLQFRG